MSEKETSLQNILKSSYIGIVRSALCMGAIYSIYYLLYDENFYIYLLPGLVKLIFVIIVCISFGVWCAAPMADIIKKCVKGEQDE